jgi:hypothetical protein
MRPLKWRRAEGVLSKSRASADRRHPRARPHLLDRSDDPAALDRVVKTCLARIRRSLAIRTRRIGAQWIAGGIAGQGPGRRLRAAATGSARPGSSGAPRRPRRGGIPSAPAKTRRAVRLALLKPPNAAFDTALSLTPVSGRQPYRIRRVPEGRPAVPVGPATAPSNRAAPGMTARRYLLVAGRTFRRVLRRRQAEEDRRLRAGRPADRGCARSSGRQVHVVRSPRLRRLRIGAGGPVRARHLDLAPARGAPLAGGLPDGNRVLFSTRT